jgi:hypothetical protein
MSYPRPQSSSAETPALTRTDPPAGPVMEPKRTEGEVLYLDGQFREATVLAWHRLDEPRRQMLTHHKISWLAQLRLSDGSTNWYEYAPSSCDAAVIAAS